MFRTIIWFIFFWIYLIVSLPKLYKAKKLKKNNEEKFKGYIKKISDSWANFLLRLAGIKVNVSGLENIPKDVPVLFVANHQSNFDIPIIIGNLQRPISFIAKVELEKMPLLGTWMKLINCVFIDRKDIRQSIRAINKGAKFIKKGQAMVIFPEGTRSADGALNEFKPGSLKLAVKSKAKIIPVTVKGSIDIMKKGSLKIKPGMVDLIISKPIEIDEDERDTILMATMVKGKISENLGGVN